MSSSKKFITCLALGGVLAGGLLTTMPQKVEAAWWTTLAFKIVNYAGNAWFDRAPTWDENANAITVSSGDISFNDGTYGASSKKVVAVTEDTGELDIWAQTGWYNWPGSISVLITTSWGSDVVSKSVTHNQHVYYAPGYPGDFTVRWVQNKRQSWDLWLRYWKGSNYPTVVGNSRSFSGEFDVTKSTGKTVKAVEINNRIHIVPSLSHSKGARNSNALLSMADLNDQSFDRQLAERVDDLRDYQVGDRMRFQDVVQAVEYDSTKNETVFTFTGKNEQVQWPFAGNLTDRFPVGSTLALEFQVVANDERFETIDYIKYGYENGGKAPTIESFVR